MNKFEFARIESDFNLIEEGCRMQPINRYRLYPVEGGWELSSYDGYLEDTIIHEFATYTDAIGWEALDYILKGFPATQEEFMRLLNDEYSTYQNDEVEVTEVQQLILATKRVDEDYYNKTLASRCAGGLGSHYPTIAEPQELEDLILGLKWEETKHPNVPEECRVFKSIHPAISGVEGVISLSALPKGTMLKLVDPKGTGKVTPEIPAKRLNGVLKSVYETYLIAGVENGVEMMFTFHPSEPIQPSRCSGDGINTSTYYTREECEDLGLTHAKVSF